MGGSPKRCRKEIERIMADEVLLTQEGYDKLVEERDELVSVRRKEVAARLMEAISYGDLSENAEYDAAKNEQAELEARIEKVEAMIRNAKIIRETEMSGDVATVGLKVEVLDHDRNETSWFELVGSTETDPFAEPPKISNDSMVGRSLIGHKVGDELEIPVPDGLLHYQIMQISK